MMLRNGPTKRMGRLGRRMLNDPKALHHQRQRDQGKLVVP